MSKKEDENFQKWAEELSQQVEEDEQEAFGEWIQTKSAREAYRGYLRESEFHRRLNEMNDRKEELDQLQQELKDWYEEQAPKNDALLKERDELRAQLAELGAGGPPAAAEKKELPITAQELEEIKAKAAKVDVLDKLLPAVLGDMSLVLRDMQKNNFDVDPREVIQYSLKQGVEPYRAYEILTRDERQKRYEAAQEQEKKKWFEEGRRSALASNSPDHLQPSGPSVVDYLQGLNKPDAKAPERADRVNAAMKEFLEIGQQ